MSIRPEKQIDEAINKCMEQEEKGGSKWPGMTYEQGVSEALRWMTGATDDNPMEDD